MIEQSLQYSDSSDKIMDISQAAAMLAVGISW